MRDLQGDEFYQHMPIPPGEYLSGCQELLPQLNAAMLVGLLGQGRVPQPQQEGEILHILLT